MPTTRKQMMRSLAGSLRRCAGACLLWLLSLQSTGAAAEQSFPGLIRVTVMIQAEEPVRTPDWPPSFLLRFTVGRRARVNLFLRPLEVARGAGLVIENTRGPITPPAPSVSDELERIELFVAGGDMLPWESSFEIESSLSYEPEPMLWNPDIYYVSYSHPASWLGPEEEDRKVSFTSNTLVVAVVAQKRLQELRQMRERDPAVAAASYEFRHLPRADPFPKNARFYPCMRLDALNAIKVGAQRDEILFLLGSPDACYRYRKPSDRPYDESWFYPLTGVEYGVGGLYVDFVGGKVVRASPGFDNQHLLLRLGESYDYIRFLFGAPDEIHRWKKPETGGYDEVWSYASRIRVWFLNGRVVQTKNWIEHPEFFKKEEAQQKGATESQDTTKDR